jgi:hypothetical protein
MKKKTNGKKKCYSYTTTKRNNKHNINVSLYYKNDKIVLNKTVNKNFDVIITKLNEHIKKIKSKNIQIKRNVKDISNIKNQIENSKNRNLIKQKEIISLQNQINHKQFKKNEIVSICCPYFNLLENNNVLLNQQIEELFLREIYIRKKELALKQILSSCSLNSNSPTSNFLIA